MGSFVENIDSFLTSIYPRLNNDGVCILSFYNIGALRYVTPPPWRDSTLSAELVRNRHELEVTLPSGEQFNIFCKAYEDSALKEICERYFDNVEILSSSALASFLPSQFFSSGNAAAKAKEVIKAFDIELEKSGVMHGAYFTVICRAPKHAPAE